ncbi:MAG: response regulator [Ignavibacteriae bacterium]|nr:MAG: response regulator [Ignavibacteriota bacterium]
MEKSKIMIIEDKGLISSYLLQNLNNIGYKSVFNYYDGKHAINNIINVLPDIVLIDIKLKGSMNGIETAKMIKTLYNIPIVYITTNSDIPILHKALLVQYFDYVLLPCDDRILKMTIDLVLHKNKNEIKIKESEAKYRSVAEVFKGYIYMNDSNYNIKFLNKKLKNKIGNISESTKCYKAIYGLDSECSWCPMEQILSGKNVKKVRYDEKEERWFKEIHIPLEIQKGQILKQSMLQDITDQKIKQENADKLLFDKEIMFSEIHHRIKNNLQVISSLLNIQSSQITDKNAIQAIIESRSRVNSMILIHDKLYNSKNFSHINFEEYLKDLTSHLLHLYSLKDNKISFTINAKNIILNVDTAIPAGLIVNELISNSLKHAFNNHISEGKIDINLKQHENGEYFLRVTDNGIGLPENFDLTNGSSLGMKIISILTKQIEGEMKINVDKGTEVFIKFNEFGYKGKNGNGIKHNS